MAFVFDIYATYRGEFKVANEKVCSPSYILDLILKYNDWKFWS